jgi:hypothetical protein
MRSIHWVVLVALLTAGIVSTAAGKPRKAAKPLKEVSVEFTADGETKRTPECNPGQEAVAGGLYAQRPGPVSIYPVFESARADDRGWVASGRPGPGSSREPRK